MKIRTCAEIVMYFLQKNPMRWTEFEINHNLLFGVVVSENISAGKGSSCHGFQSTPTHKMINHSESSCSRVDVFVYTLRAMNALDKM